MPLNLLHRLTLASATVSAIFVSLPIQAQIVPDATLGTQAIGACAGAGGTCGIINGTTRGSNLFHSFLQFSLPNGDVAAFITNPAIQNVIVRVTGVGQPFISNINGAIATLDPAFNLTPRNFFLLNPNGIVFGSRATLLNGGAFLATTAERMHFQDGTVFDSRDAAPLLTVSVPIGLQFGQTPGKIQAAWQISAGVNSLFTDVALVGGDIDLNGSFIISPGRRVEIGGLSASGTVGLNLSDGLSLSFPANVLRGNVSLRNDSIIDVSADQGGAITITGQNIDIDGSLLLSGMTGNGANLQAGDITLNATQQVTIGGSSNILPNSAIINAVLPNSTGNSGNLRIITGSLDINDGARILVNTIAEGNAGNIFIQARDRVTLNNGSTIESNVLPTGIGQGGTIQITAKAIALNRSQIQSLTAGQGNSGNIVLVAQNEITLAGGSQASGTASAIITGVNPTGVGSGGTLQISAGDLSLTDGAQLRTASLGRGNAGNIVVDVRDRVIFNEAQALSILTNTGVGNAGNIRISANTVELRTSESALQSGIQGRGNAGNIVINTREQVKIDGGSIISFVDRESVGQGGDIQVFTKIFEVMNRGQLNASTLGNGDAGNITVDASDLVVLNSADIASYVESSAIGNGGTIQILTQNFEANAQTQLNTSSQGAGSAGEILINVSQGLTFDNSFIASRSLTGSSGNSNDINVSADKVELKNGAKFLATTETAGTAGDIRVNANSVTISDINLQTQEPSGLISATLGSGRGGNILVNTDALRLLNGALIDVRTIASGDSGSITVNANTVELRNGSQLGAATEGTGKAGTITVNARNQVAIAGIDPTFNSDRLSASANSGIVVRSLASGEAGDIFITTPQLRLDQGVLDAQSATVDGGNINLTIQDLLLMRRGSQISATAGTAEAGGNGGNININAPRGFIIGVKGENSDITANAFTGSGGQVNITAQGIYGLQFRPRLTEFSDITASSTFGVSGVVAINTLGVDPSRGLQQLPGGLVDPSNRIDQKCAAGSGFRQSSFTVTGRGGLPENPLEPLQSSEGIASWVEVGTENTHPSTPTSLPDSSPPLPSHPSTPSLLIEADSVMVDKDGSVQLVASQQMAEPGSFWQPTCSSLREGDRRAGTTQHIVQP
ncbi:filamentous hemagglutinin N-terminal domain-containing protein [Leptolyngbyaceae cyanobacterium UHCC 1019]